MTQTKTFTYNNSTFTSRLEVGSEMYTIKLSHASKVLSTYEVSRETYFDCKNQNGEDLIEELFDTAESDIRNGIVKFN